MYYFTPSTYYGYSSSSRRARRRAARRASGDDDVWARARRPDRRSVVVRAFVLSGSSVSWVFSSSLTSASARRLSPSVSRDAVGDARARSFRESRLARPRERRRARRRAPRLPWLPRRGDARRRECLEDFESPRASPKGRTIDPTANARRRTRCAWETVRVRRSSVVVSTPRRLRRRVCLACWSKKANRRRRSAARARAFSTRASRLRAV